MKKFSLLFVLVFFCSFNPKISVAEPGFFLQTLTNTFVDWMFGRLDDEEVFSINFEKKWSNSLKNSGVEPSKISSIFGTA